METDYTIKSNWSYPYLSICTQENSDDSDDSDELSINGQMCKHNGSTGRIWVIKDKQCGPAGHGSCGDYSYNVVMATQGMDVIVLNFGDVVSVIEEL